MKEHIYTIDINEAIEKDGECFLCIIEEKLEKAAVEYYMGAAMMEPDIRCETNKKGFCPVHYKKMKEIGNSLPLALVLQTRINEIFDHIEVEEKKKKTFFSKNSDAELADVIRDDFSGCAICERVSKYMDNCISNFMSMLINDKEFSNKFFSSKGLCMKHFEKVLRYAKGDLKNQIIEHQKKEMKRVMDDVDRFVLKFDYRNADMPWENAKDATERAILKLRGDYFGKY